MPKHPTGPVMNIHQMILQDIPDGYWLTDMEGLLLEVNAAYCAMSGYTTEELLTMRIADLEAMETPAETTNHLHKIIASGKELYASRHRRKDGTIVDVEVSAHVIPAAGGRIACFFRDITNSLKLEQALREQELLIHTGEMAEGVAHDLNNALFITVGALGLAQHALNSPSELQEAKESIAIAQTGMATAAELVKQLQQFARRRTSTARQPINLNQLLETAVLQIKPLWKNTAEKNGITFVITTQFDEIQLIDGNERVLLSVFINLLKNAIEAMPHGGTITIETKTSKHGVLVRIIDTGMGMLEKIRDKLELIFKNKATHHPLVSTKDSGGVRGLGTRNVAAFIREHGAEIIIAATAPGQGTTIELVFPISNQQQLVVHIQPQEEKQQQARVLWVDDEETIRNLGSRMLKRLDHVAHTAQNGHEALTLLEHASYDLLITDLSMAGMSGLQLAAAIKGKYPRMKRALLTGWSEHTFPKDIATAGIDYVLAKPINLPELKKVIDQVLKDLA